MGDIDLDLEKHGEYVNTDYFPDYQKPKVKPEVMEAMFDEMFNELQELKAQRKEMVLAIRELQENVTTLYVNAPHSLPYIKFLYQPKVI